MARIIVTPDEQVLCISHFVGGAFSGKLIDTESALNHLMNGDSNSVLAHNTATGQFMRETPVQYRKVVFHLDSKTGGRSTYFLLVDAKLNALSVSPLANLAITTNKDFARESVVQGSLVVMPFLYDGAHTFDPDTDIRVLNHACIARHAIVTRLRVGGNYYCGISVKTTEDMVITVYVNCLLPDMFAAASEALRLAAIARA